MMSSADPMFQGGYMVKYKHSTKKRKSAQNNGWMKDFHIKKRDPSDGLFYNRATSIKAVDKLEKEIDIHDSFYNC